MQKLQVDLGVKEYELGGGVLRINPSDPNLYDRFVQATETIRQIEDGMVARAKELPQGDGQQNGVAAVKLMRDADGEIKKVLNEAFGLGNDFDRLLEGVNLLAVGANGERIVTNLLAALIPLIETGARQLYGDKANRAVALAKANRAQRRAAAKKK